MPKLRITSFRCEIRVEGIDMVCPFCGDLIASGYRHVCTERELGGKKPRRKQAVKRG